MNTYRYNEPLPKLELDKRRFRVKFCPCGKNNKDGKFVPYVGHENKGYCHSCGETFLPELPKAEQWNTPQYKEYKHRPVTPQPKPVSFIPVEVFKASLKAHETNYFVQFLINLFGVEVASQLVSRYFIATSKHWNGATVFWQIDTQGKVRTGKIMLYSPNTGKRVKEPFNHINWVHKAIKQPEFELRQCLFGEHFLIDKTKPIALCESEKTAVIASVYLPQFIWVAVGSLTNLNAERCSKLKGRTVTLFPDLNGFEKWSSKAKELSHLANFTVSDLLERKATEAERKQGFDLADYLIRYDFKEFQIPEPEATEPPPTVQPLVEVKELFKQSLLNEALTTGYGNPDKWFEYYKCKGLTANEAIQAAYEIRNEYGFNIEGETPPAVQPLVEVKIFEQPEPVYYFSKPKQPKPESWEQDITELENYFASIELPTQPVKLNKCSTITNCSLFIESHFATLKAYNGKRTFLPYLNRLQELKQVLTTNLN